MKDIYAEIERSFDDSEKDLLEGSANIPQLTNAEYRIFITMIDKLNEIDQDDAYAFCLTKILNSKKLFVIEPNMTENMIRGTIRNIEISEIINKAYLKYK